MSEKVSRERGPGDEVAETETPRFEVALSKLQESVARLEAGELDLSDALACYEQGIRQLKVCHELLADAERRIELLCGVDAEGNPVVQSYDDDQLSLEEKRENRGQRRTHRSEASRRGDGASEG